MIYALKNKAVILTVIASLLITLTDCTVQKRGKSTDKKTIEIVQQHFPSISLLYKLYFIVYESKELTKSWAYVYRSDDAIDKVRLISLHSEIYPSLKKELEKYKGKWSIKEQLQLREIFKDIETLFEKEKGVMEQLNSYEAYEDVMIVFQVDSEFERGSNSITSHTEEILKKISELTTVREEKLKATVNAPTDTIK